MMFYLSLYYCLRYRTYRQSNYQISRHKQKEITPGGRTISEHKVVERSKEQGTKVIQAEAVGGVQQRPEMDLDREKKVPIIENWRGQPKRSKTTSKKKVVIFSLEKGVRKNWVLCNNTNQKQRERYIQVPQNCLSNWVITKCVWPTHINYSHIRLLAYLYLFGLPIVVSINN